jgi:NAD(P)-dependent dehydrogenase (short-subunit alcohol dehydrogenase family)
MSEIWHRPLNGSTPPSNGAAPPTTAEPSSAPPGPYPAEEVMGRYQDVMQQFLETQRTVMLAYLGQRGGSGRGQDAVQARVAPTPPARAPLALHGTNTASTAPTAGPGPSAVPTDGAARAVAEPAPVPAPPSGSSPPVALPMSTDAVTSALLEVVSSRTGYPADMLGLDADLEADLGIDSIKRVEIAGQVMRALPMPESAAREVEKVTASRTLRQAATVLHELLSPASSAAAEPLPFAVEPVGAGHTGRLVSQLSAAPDSGAPAGLAPGAVVVVTGGSNPVADLLTQTLRARGLPVEVTTASLADLADPAVADAFLASVRVAHGRVAALLHLGALAPDAGDGTLRSMFTLTRAALTDLLAAAGQGGSAAIAVRTTDGAGVDWSSGGLTGFCRTLALEEPTVRVRALHLDRAAPADDAVAAVLAALDSSDESAVVVAGARSSGRRVPVLVPAPADARQPSAALGADAVVLLTGGARGITAEASLALAEAYRPTLVLVGRTRLVDEPVETEGVEEPGDLRAAMTAHLRSSSATVTPATVERALADLRAGREVRATLSRLGATGARTEYVSCDLRDATAFAAVVDGVYARHGRIDGVVHGAGVVEDKLLAAKTAESFSRVTGTKLIPARVLAERLRPDTLRFLVFFSSVSARVGNRGQCDYAAANSALDALALELDARWAGHVVSIGWGPWAAGMVSPELAREFASRGVPLLSADEGRRAFLDELTRGRKGEVEVVVAALTGDGDAPTLQGPPAPLPRTRHPLLSVGTTRSDDGSGRLTLTRTFDLACDPCLDDHRIEGRPVVPFAYALELVCEAAGELLPGAVVGGVDQVRLATGIALAGGRASVRVDAHRSADGRVAVVVSGTEPPARQHYSAVVRVAERALDTLARPQPDPLLTGGPEPGVREAYEDLLFHGPSFQGIEELRLGPNGATAVLRTASPDTLVDVAAGASWLLDPLVIDSALQLQVVWARLNWDVTLLPTGLDRVDVLGAFAGVDRVRHEMRIVPTSRDPLCHADHWLHDDATGRPLAYLQGMTGAGSRALNRIVGPGRRAAVAGAS